MLMSKQHNIATYVWHIRVNFSHRDKMTQNNYSGTPLNRHPSSVDTHNITDNSERGEFKVWIYHFYLVQPIRFCQAVDMLLQSSLQKIHSLATKHLKKWLCLEMHATQVILYHPSGLKCPSIPAIKTQARMSYLASIFTSPDHLLHELKFQTDSAESCQRIGFPRASFSILQAARSHIQSLPTAKKLSGIRKCLAIDAEKEAYSNHLSSLQVRSKLQASLDLEIEAPVWKRILWGLPPGQLSYILRPSSDTLPTPMNMLRWRIQTDPKSLLSGDRRAKTQHILNGCPTALNQGCYTWRHDSDLYHLVIAIQLYIPAGSTVYADLDSYKASSNPPSTIPHYLTWYRPDMVIIGNDFACYSSGANCLQ